MQHGQASSAGSACPNCRTLLQGRWCHACGQKDADYHRSIRHLVEEATEGLTHADGRLWTTWRRLILRPGRLTRDYLDGKRAPQLPPFRMFLIAIILLLLAGPIGNLGPNKMHIRFMPLQLASPHAGIGGGAIGRPVAEWLHARAVQASRDPERALAAMERWSHYAAMLTVLVTAPLLALAFMGQRFYFYDHLIFAMHSLAFQMVLLASALITGGWLMLTWLVLLLAPVHLFVHMRGTYRTTIVGTLLRMLVLAIGSAIGFGLLLTLLVIVGLSAAT